MPLACYMALNNAAATKRYTIGRSYCRGHSLMVWAVIAGGEILALRYDHTVPLAR